MNTKIAVISALAPVSIALAFGLATPAKAGGSLTNSCFASTKTKAISCCDAYVKSNGLPIWMHSKDSCSQAAFCVKSGGGKTYVAKELSINPLPCGIKVFQTQDPSNTPPPSGGSPTQHPIG